MTISVGGPRIDFLPVCGVFVSGLPGKVRWVGWALLLAVWIVLVAVGLSRLQTNIEDVRPWLPDNSRQRQNYDWFVNTFGSDDTVIVSWDGCRLGEPSVAALADAYRQHDSRYVRSVVSAAEALDEVASRARLSRDEAIDRLQGFLIGPDRQTTCLLLYLTREGMRDRRSAIQSIIDLAVRTTGLPAAELHIGGRPYLGYYTSELTLRSLTRLSLPVVVLSMLFAWLAMRDIGLLMITLCSAGFSAVSALAVVPWCGFELSGLLAALPSLVFVIATSGTVHLVNYAAEIARSTSDSADAISMSARRHALRRKALRPCLLSSASTALGTLSLVWSQFSAIRDFGLFATIGVGITLLVHVFLVPRLLAWHGSVFPPPVGERRLVGGMMSLLDLVVRSRRAVIAGTLALSGVMALGLVRLEGRFRIDELFTERSDFLRHARWLEANLGAVDATEVVLRFDNTDGSGILQRVERMHQLERALASMDEISAVHSAATLIPETSGIQSVLSRMWARAALERRRSDLVDGNLIAETPEATYWRITLRTSLFDEIDRGRLREQIIQAVRDLTADWDRPPSVIVTGATQVFEESKDNVLRDFTESLLLAYAFILVLMVVALRSLVAGLLAMIPNIVPNIVVFGGLGWIDGAIDMGMTIAACIALGIAVDDTSHLLMSYRDDRRELPRDEALRTAYRQCGPAMCQTSLICGVALVPYLWAELIYLSRFGLVIPLLMAGALVGDMLLLPALIVSRLGHCFDKGRPAGTTPELRQPSD